MVGRAWTGFIWVRIGKNSLINCYKSSCCIKCGKVTDEDLPALSESFLCVIADMVVPYHPYSRRQNSLLMHIIKFYLILCYSHNKEQFLFMEAQTDRFSRWRPGTFCKDGTKYFNVWMNFRVLRLNICFRMPMVVYGNVTWI